jgi:hypothetical protein
VVFWGSLEELNVPICGGANTLTGHSTVNTEVLARNQRSYGEMESYFQKIGLNAIDAAATTSL